MLWEEVLDALVTTTLDPKALEAEILLEGFVPDETVVDSDPESKWFTHYLNPATQVELLTRENKSTVCFHRDLPPRKRKLEQVVDPGTLSDFDSARFRQ